MLNLRSFLRWRSHELERPAPIVPPTIDVQEKDEAVEIRAEMPGIAEEEIDVRVDGPVVRLRAQRQHESESLENDVATLRTAHVLWERTIPLPSQVEADLIDARYDDGVLHLTLLKRADALRESARRIPVNS